MSETWLCATSEYDARERVGAGHLCELAETFYVALRVAHAALDLLHVLLDGFDGVLGLERGGVRIRVIGGKGRRNGHS